MRRFLALAGFVSLMAVGADSSVPPELEHAQAELARIRQLVEAGAAPRAELDRAQEGVDDARDAAFLKRTLYGQELTPYLTEAQSDEVLATAARRLERRRKTLERSRDLVKEGVIAPAGLEAETEELDRARTEYDLAVSRVKLTQELARMARAEQDFEETAKISPEEARGIAQRFDGSGAFTPRELSQIRTAFAGRFERDLPVSAQGETALHRALGFDHRNRVDVALHPDQPEGVWLRGYLEARDIPYFAFRRAVPGKATAAHIHIGPMSERL